jgi:acid phosphatase
MHQARNKKNARLALVLDIDETSLSNYDFLAAQNFSSNSKQLQKEIFLARAKAIKPMLSLYHQALSRGIRVFFVSGRAESWRKPTQENLRKAGYQQWSALYLRPDEYKPESIGWFKTQARKKIEAKGYTIIANIGDQFSDLRGGYAQKEFKLPNPFYYLP